LNGNGEHPQPGAPRSSLRRQSRHVLQLRSMGGTVGSFYSGRVRHAVVHTGALVELEMVVQMRDCVERRRIKPTGGGNITCEILGHQLPIGFDGVLRRLCVNFQLGRADNRGQFRRVAEMFFERLEVAIGLAKMKQTQVLTWNGQQTVSLL